MVNGGKILGTRLASMVFHFGRTDENNVMTTSCGNFHRTFCGFLTFHFRKIKRKMVYFFLKFFSGVKFCSFQRNIFVKEINNLFNVFYTVNFQIIDNCGFSYILFGKIMPLKPSSLAFIAMVERLLSVANLRLEKVRP